MKYFLKATRSQRFITSSLKKEKAHNLPLTGKSADIAFYLKPSRRQWQSPQLRVKIKPVLLLPPPSGVCLMGSHGAERWQPVIETSPEERQAAQTRRLEDELSSASRATEAGAPRGSPRSGQTDFTPLFSAPRSLPLCEGLNFPVPHSSCYFAILSPQCDACAEGNAMVLWLGGHKREVSRTQQTKLQFLSPLGFPSTPCL